MIKASVMIGLLKSLETYVTRLESLRPASLNEWSQDFTNYWAALHGLQVAVQHVVDIGNHILTAQSLATPTDYRETLLELGRNNVLPMEFAEKISSMAGFRNIIVHQYLGVDPVKVFTVMQNDLDDFRAFVEYIDEYLRREGVI